MDARESGSLFWRKIAYDLKIDAVFRYPCPWNCALCVKPWHKQRAYIYANGRILSDGNQDFKILRIQNEIPEIILSNLLYMDNYLYIDEAGITFRYLYSDEMKVTNEISILDQRRETA